MQPKQHQQQGSGARSRGHAGVWKTGPQHPGPLRTPLCPHPKPFSFRSPFYLFSVSIPQVNTIHLLLVSRTPDQPHLLHDDASPSGSSRAYCGLSSPACNISIDSSITASVQDQPLRASARPLSRQALANLRTTNCGIAESSSIQKRRLPRSISVRTPPVSLVAFLEYHQEAFAHF
jgi:hypothetical protein